MSKPIVIASAISCTVFVGLFAGWFLIVKPKTDEADQLPEIANVYETSPKVEKVLREKKPVRKPDSTLPASLRKISKVSVNTNDPDEIVRIISRHTDLPVKTESPPSKRYLSVTVLPMLDQVMVSTRDRNGRVASITLP